MHNARATRLFLLAIGMLALVGCDAGYGTKLEFNGGQLFYTKNVTAAEANSLGEYLVKEKFYDGNPKSVQLNKSGSTYEFRMVVKKGLESDQSYVDLGKVFAKELSENVFSGSQVDVHFCDDQLKTLRVILAN
jgi:hypothetical protein